MAERQQPTRSKDAISGYVNSRVRRERPSQIDGWTLGITWGDTHRIPQAEQPETRRKPLEKSGTVFDRDAVATRVDAFNNWRKGIQGKI